MSVTDLFCFITVDENTTSALITKKKAWCGSTQWILTTTTGTGDQNVYHGKEDAKMVIRGFLAVDASMTGTVVFFATRTNVLKSLGERSSKTPVIGFLPAHHKKAPHRALDESATSFRRTIGSSVVTTGSLGLNMNLS